MQSGTQLGRYEIRRKIGSGGMGEVFEAHDGQLDRFVALKVLLPEFCCDLERVQRFKLEAKAVSALNHPNIITIHEINEDREQLFIATEVVDGKTLREIIEGRELTLRDALRIARQIAEALAVAHEANIVHRDIKPENIMVRRDGIVKILDFGLAKPILQQSVGAEAATVQIVKTLPGIVMGSVRYMSPEQARGRETDARTDVWSLGVVLYEMLTGTNPFEGETIGDSLAAVIHVEPRPLTDVPEELHRIVRKALKKSASDRYHSIRDFALDLKDLLSATNGHSNESPLAEMTQTVSARRHSTTENATLIHQTTSAENRVSDGTSAAEPHGRFSLAPLWILSLALILGLGGWFLIPSLLQTGVPVFESIQATRLTDNLTSGLAEISPDGRFAAYVDRRDGRQSLLVKQIVTGSIVTLVSESNLSFYQPTYTPDGEFVYYVEVERNIGTLYRIPAFGGERVKLLVDIDSKVTFSPDGSQIAFIRHDPNEGGDRIFVAEADGANPEQFLHTKDVGYDQFSGLDWSPDGRTMLVTVYKSDAELAERLNFATVGIDDKELTIVGSQSWYGVKSFSWTRDGDGIVLVGKPGPGDNTQVWHLSYPSGDVRHITTDTSDYASISVSADGNTIVATRVDTVSSFWTMNAQTRETRPLTGDNKNLIGMAGFAQLPGGRILFVKKAGKDVHIYSMDENGGTEKSLTSGTGINVDPVATPDGKYIAFVSNRVGNWFSVWRANQDGTNLIRLTTAVNANDGKPQFTPDGKYIVFMRQTSDRGRAKIMKVPVEGGEATSLFADAARSELFPRLSGDGTRLVYHTFDYDNKVGSFIWSVRMLGINDGSIDPKVPETELKIDPEYRWSPDNRSLTYLKRSGVPNLWSITIDSKENREKQITDFTSGLIMNFGWSNDGRKLLIVRATVNTDLVLIKNVSGT